MNITDISQLATLTADDVVSSYSGKHGCACGCIGHRYNPAHLKVAKDGRGYAIRPEEVSIRSIKSTLTKMQKCAETPKAYKWLLLGDMVSVDTETRTYILYLVEG